MHLFLRARANLQELILNRKLLLYCGTKKRGREIKLDKGEIKKKIASFPRWHYEFNLRGIKTPVFRPDHAIRHPLRRDHIFPKLLEACGGSFSGKRILDLGCNAGWWSIEAVRRGADFVLGIDARDMHIEQAKFVAEVLGIRNVEFRKMNVYDISRDTIGKFDITLCLGLLYHVNRPLGLLEKVFEVTKEVAVIDTAVLDLPVPTSRNPILFISDLLKHLIFRKPVHGPYIKLRYEKADDPRATYKSGIVCKPTLEAIIMMLKEAGFRNIIILENKGKLPKDYLRNERFSILVYKDKEGDKEKICRSSDKKS